VMLLTGSLVAYSTPSDILPVRRPVPPACASTVIS
jgi:hypothetical protein